MFVFSCPKLLGLLLETAAGFCEKPILELSQVNAALEQHQLHDNNNEILRPLALHFSTRIEALIKKRTLSEADLRHLNNEARENNERSAQQDNQQSLERRLKDSAEIEKHLKARLEAKVANHLV